MIDGFDTDGLVEWEFRRGFVHEIAATRQDRVDANGVVVAEGWHVAMMARSRDKLAELARDLADGPFIRIHRSTIVNIGRVKEIRPLSHGEFVLVLGDGTKLKVSRSYSDNVRTFLDKIT